MNRTKLMSEGKKWVSEGIISESQLEQILGRYKPKDPNTIILLFAVLLSGLGFLTFITSDWARVPHFSRIVIIAAIFVALYLVGDYLFRKTSTFLGISFITLGYIVFGSGLLLTLNVYNVELFSVWPHVIWAAVGLALYAVYKHPFIFVIAMVVTTGSQLYSGASLSSFDWLLLLLLVMGFGHYVYHQATILYGYLMAFSISLQMVVLVMAENQEYYWLIVYFLVIYIIGSIAPKETLQVAFTYTALLSIFIFGMYQTFMLQEDFFMSELKYDSSFPVVWILLIVLAFWIKWRKKEQLGLVDLVLFLPVFYLPYAFVLGLISLFTFSLLWLFIGYIKGSSEVIFIGTAAFLLSTFTVYIQYAWDALNKSLFFLIGGILLFLISFFMERQRRKLLHQRKGGV